ncbi:hypothetical protein ACIQF6_20415 [Kitasatospora sp. NPDC092948]|uniref:hypothetical protein n=1 Tax=Kitasatospora sp. NPDC092948 TaxID=3364088 RepID=UPI0038267DF2
MIGAVGHLRATGVIGGANPPPPSPAVAVVLLFLLLGVVISSSALTAIICFNRPRFLIPPHLRDWPGVMSTRRRRPTEPQEAERDAVDDHPRITPATTPQQDRPDTVPIPHQRPTVRQEAGRDVMSEQASAPGSVRVSRDATSPRDRLRAYTILVDDAAVAKVRPGKSVSVGLSPGPHTVRVKIDWCRSPELVVTVAAGAEHRLECGPRVAGGGDMSMVTTERDTYLWLRPSDESAG